MTQALLTSMAVERPKALVFAYSAEPYQGSEPGGGWGIVMALSRVADLTVLVKSEHIPGIRRWERSAGLGGLSFVEIRPRVPRSLQKLHRITEFLTYLHWLRAAERAAERMHAEEPFDFVHHVTYSVYWLPTPATGLPIPCIWGPVAGGVRAPRVLWRALGFRGLFDEFLDRFAVTLAAHLPATRRSWKEASVRIVQNQETRDRLPLSLRSETHILNAGLLTKVDAPPVTERDPVVVFPSALIPRKCPRLALEALIHAPRVTLQFVHTGPQERMLRRLAVKYGVVDRVEFLGKIPRRELFQRLARASAAVFTGVREEGGLALSEAMSLGTPVVVLSVGGARTICQACVDPSRVLLVDPEAPEGVALQLARAMQHFVIHPSLTRTPNLDVDAAERRLRRLIELALAQEPGSLGDLIPGRGNDKESSHMPTPIHDRRPAASATGGDR